MGTALGWLLVVAFGVLSWPVPLGGQTGYVIVSGHSMSGTFDDGDLVVTRDRQTYDVGQAVVYTVPEGEPGEGLRVVHRIVGGDGDTGFITRGDALDADDPWQPRSEDVSGAVVLHLSGAGFLLTTLLHPLVLAALAGALATAAMLSSPPRREPVTEPEESRVDA